MGGTTLVQDQPTAPPTEAPGPASTGAVELGPRRVRLVFLALMLALLLAALEQMIVATALPKIIGELHGLDRMSWAVTAYLLTATVGLPVHGKRRVCGMIRRTGPGRAGTDHGSADRRLLIRPRGAPARAGASG